MLVSLRFLCLKIAALILLSGCAERPSPLSWPPPEYEIGTLQASKALEKYYRQLEVTLRSRGLLRTDQRAKDVPFDMRDLLENFETVVFYDEYQRGSTFEKSKGENAKLSKWVSPIRVKVHFGPSISELTRAEDEKNISDFVSKLAQVTNHPMRMVSQNSNFDVLISREDEHPFMLDTLKAQGAPLGSAAKRIITQMPRNIHCLVLAFSDPETEDVYSHALAVIRAEHPDILKLACIHEEISQGLGLSNDSLRARPSIFNDDDEFAFLTDHDEILLKMLYDPRLSPGLSLAEARPIFQQIAREIGPPNR